MAKLTKEQIRIANSVFRKFAKHNFATGVYETSQPFTYTTSASTSATVSYPTAQFVITGKTVQCQAAVPGLDEDLFIAALQAYMDEQAAQVFKILQN